MYSTKMPIPSIETSQFHEDAAGGHARGEKPPRNDLPVLAAFYYLKNFELVLAAIESRYSDLLLEDELRFIALFRRLPMESRALLVCMVMRRGELFRAGKLKYIEIGETRAAAVPLIEAGWVSDRPLLRFEDVHGIL